MSHNRTSIQNERTYAITASIALGLLLIAIVTIIMISGHRMEAEEPVENSTSISLTNTVSATLDIDQETNSVLIIATSHSGNLTDVSLCQVKDKDGVATSASNFNGTLSAVSEKTVQTDNQAIDMFIIRESQTNTLYAVCVGQGMGGFTNVDIEPIDSKTYTVQYD